MRQARGWRWVWPSVGLAAAVGLVGIFLWLDYGSLERGNRLYRDGQTQKAEQLFRARAQSVPPSPRASYNLGTTLLAFDSQEAQDYLRVATEAEDSATAHRAYYNLGYYFLAMRAETIDPQSAIQVVEAAVRYNRAALRIAPDDENARWNFALATWKLDSLMQVYEAEQVAEEEEGEQETADGVVVARPGQNSPPGMGGIEALAGEDPGLLTEDAAHALVQDINTDVERLLWGILWSHRPETPPWSDSYPAGPW